MKRRKETSGVKPKPPMVMNTHKIKKLGPSWRDDELARKKLEEK